VIVLDNVSKAHGDKLAVDRLNLHIRPGEFFGLLGPNGTWKTATIR